MTERTMITVVSDLIKTGLTVEQQILVHELLDMKRPRTDAERAKTYRERHDSHDERDARDIRDAAPLYPPRDIYNSYLGSSLASLGTHSDSSIDRKSLVEEPPSFPPTEDFDEFWELYPRKTAKGHARKAYKNALKRATHEEIIAGVKNYRREMAGKEAEFLKHPATWLNADCWLDEPTKPVNDFVYSGQKRTWAEIQAERKANGQG